MLLGKSRGQLLIAPERMKWLGPSGSDSQLWMCLVVKVKCKEQYCIRTWNVRSTNQSKSDVVKQEMARGNTDILEMSENGQDCVNLIQMTIVSAVWARIL